MYFLPSSQTLSSFCHPFSLSESGDDLFSPLSLSPSHPSQPFLLLSSLFHYRRQAVALSLRATPSLVCSSFLLPSLPLSTCSPSFPPLPTCWINCCTDHIVVFLLFYVTQEVPCPFLRSFSFPLSHSLLPSLSLLGIKLSGDSWGVTLSRAPQDNKVKISTKENRRICSDFTITVTHTACEVTGGHYPLCFLPVWM